MPELNESLDIDFTEHAKGRFCDVTVSLRLKFFYSNSCSLMVIDVRNSGCGPYLPESIKLE